MKYRKCFLFLFVFLFNLNYSFSQKENQPSPYNDSVFYSGTYLMKIDQKVIDNALLYPSKRTQRELYNLYFCKGFILFLDNKNIESIKYFDKALKTKIDHSKKPYIESILLFIKAYALDPLSQEKALRTVIKADSILMKNYRAFGLGKTREYIIELFLEKGQLETALNWTLEAEKIFQKHGDITPDMVLVSKISIYNQLGTKTKNEVYFKKAKDLCDVLIKRNDFFKDNVYKVRILSEKGQSLSNLGNSNEALQLFEEAMNINQSIGNYDASILQKINIFHENIKIHNNSKAIELGEELIIECQNNSYKNRLIEIYFDLAKAYKNTKQFEKSNKTLFKYVKENEKLLKQQYSANLNELAIKYQSKIKDETIQTLSKEKKQEELLKKSKQRQLRMTIIGLISLSLVLAFAFITLLKLNKARNNIRIQSTELASKNELLNHEIHQKNFLFRELHHRVKNNFQLIMSFMRLQQNNNANNAELIIQNVELKMNAMSMVHEMLYKEGSFENINISSYLHELSGSVIETINDQDTDVEIEISGDQPLISIEKAIPIGLVMNEIITNSIKHNNIEDLSISISIQDLDDFIILSIEDNGSGFPEDFDPQKSASLGTRVILLLMKQINAKANWINSIGAKWVFTIPR